MQNPEQMAFQARHVFEPVSSLALYSPGVLLALHTSWVTLGWCFNLSQFHLENEAAPPSGSETSPSRVILSARLGPRISPKGEVASSEPGKNIHRRPHS